MDDWIDSGAHLLDVRIFLADVWLGLLSLMAWTSLLKIPTDSSVTMDVRALLMIELRLRDARSSVVNEW